MQLACELKTTKSYKFKVPGVRPTALLAWVVSGSARPLPMVGGPPPHPSPLGESARDAASPRWCGRRPPTFQWTLQRLGGRPSIVLSRTTGGRETRHGRQRQATLRTQPTGGTPPAAASACPSSLSPPPLFPLPQRLPFSHSSSRSAPPPLKAVSHSFRPFALRAPRVYVLVAVRIVNV